MNSILNLNINFSINDQLQNSKEEDNDEMLIDDYYVKKEKIIKILLTPFDERTEEQKSIIQSYILNLSNITKKFSMDNIDEKDYNEIISQSANTSQYCIIKNIGMQIYNINEEAHFFYIILKGNVKIYDLKKIYRDLNGHGYYDILLNYRNKRENSLLKKTIDENYHIYPVEYADMKLIDKIMIKLNLMKLETDNDPNIDPDYLEYLLKYYGSSFKQYNLETYMEVIRKKNEKIMEINKILIEQQSPEKCKSLLEYNIYDARLHSKKNADILKDHLNYISPELCRKYYFFMNENLEGVNYYELFIDKIRTVNDYFGDLENNRYTQRAVTNSENVELLKMNNDMYKEFIKREKAKIIDAQVSFFLNNFFFDRISKEYFIRYYFPLFEPVSYSLDQVIISQNEKVHYVYFIKSGIVKLMSNRSILENYIIMDLIKNTLKKAETSDIYEEDDDNKSNVKDYKFKSDVQHLKKELNIRHENHLITYQTNQAMGYECFYYGTNYLYKAKAESKEVKIYRIKIRHLIEIFKEKGQVGYKHLIKKAKNQMKLLLERFTLINNDLMKFYDRKLLYKKSNIELKSNTHRNKINKEIRKLKNKKENFGVILSAHNENNNKNNIIFGNRYNNINSNINNSESERRNFIKNLFQNRILKYHKLNSKIIPEDSKLKSPDILKENKRSFSYMDFFEEKTFNKKLSNNKLFKYDINLKKIDSHIASDNKLININTNYTFNTGKEVKRNSNLKLINSQKKQLFLSNNYFFSENSEINNNDNILDQTLLRNKKLLSNIFCSISNNNYKKISNEEIKKKLAPKKMDKYTTLKYFNNVISKQFSLDKNNISYKYDFRRGLDNNLRLLKYSIFDSIKTPKTDRNSLSMRLHIIRK